MKPKKYVNEYGRIIEAIQVTADNLHEVAEWCGGKVYLSVIDETPMGVTVGVRTAYCGNWIIKNEYEWMDEPIWFGVCKKDIFDRLYNEVVISKLQN